MYPSIISDAHPLSCDVMSYRPVMLTLLLLNAAAFHTFPHYRCRVTKSRK